MLELHCANHEDKIDSRLPRPARMHAPNIFQRYQENDEIRHYVEHATDIEQDDDADARPWNGLVPNLCSRDALVDFGNGQCAIEHADDEKKGSNEHIELAPATW